MICTSAVEIDVYVQQHVWNWHFPQSGLVRTHQIYR